MSNTNTLGSAISSARKARGLSQKELAALIKREDGTAISPQYLNDIEHNRRSPSSDHLMKQFAATLAIDLDYLYYLADRFPEDLRRSQLSSEQVANAMRAFRRSKK